jgi:hypothetical protein
MRRRPSRCAVRVPRVLARFGNSYDSPVPDESRRTRRMGALKRAAKWRPQTNRQKWLVVLTVVIVACAPAIVFPAMRTGLLSFAVYAVVMGWLGTESRRSRREREALSARLALLEPGDVPADVVSLVAAGKKIQAIKRYRQLTGASLGEAKTFIDGL